MTHEGKKWIAVFCASAAGSRPGYLAAARDLGRMIAERNYGLVYGGATVGAMHALADAALAEGGKVMGVIPDVIMDLEIGHRGLTELHVVRTMHERKALMASRADAFVALPGGYGTTGRVHRDRYLGAAAHSHQAVRAGERGRLLRCVAGILRHSG